MENYSLVESANSIGKKYPIIRDVLRSIDRFTLRGEFDTASNLCDLCEKFDAVRHDEEIRQALAARRGLLP